MMASAREDGLRIWRAGVEAVRSDRLVQRHVTVGDGRLRFGDLSLNLDALGRIEVVGAGKAGAGMALGLESALGPEILASGRLDGWINVPADCVRPTSRIHLHPARPAGRNEPAPEGVEGANEILRRVRSLRSNDLCICLISGGGSALLPAPRPETSLEDLRNVTQQLSAAGATIQQLNAIRRRLSLIQGGQLARACRAGQLVTLIISDVMGDPLDVIASGPTIVTEELCAAQEAADVFAHFTAKGVYFSKSVGALLQADLRNVPNRRESGRAPGQITNLVIGNNPTATQAAKAEAERLGYTVRLAAQHPIEATAEEIGRQLAETLNVSLKPERADEANCIVSGGEPVVHLVDAAARGRGGRNQQLVLAALCQLTETASASKTLHRQALLSGGTDGEDGPTDAAGAVADEDVVRRMRERHLDPGGFLRRNDAYRFFDATGGLIRTGPTHTNVCDLRVVISK